MTTYEYHNLKPIFRNPWVRRPLIPLVILLSPVLAVVYCFPTYIEALRDLWKDSKRAW